jgi:hypothetical protein
MTNTVSGMQRHRVKMFGSSPYATVLDDFDFRLSRHVVCQCDFGVAHLVAKLCSTTRDRR